MSRGARHLGPVVLVLLLLGTGCNDSEHVDLGFRAPEGTTVDYRIEVESVVETELADPPRTTTEQVRLDARQRVGSVPQGEGGEVELQITISRDEGRARVFEMRFDPSRGLAEIDSVEGLPVEALGELGPSRLVLLATGLLPDRPLRPGETWEIDRRLELPGGARPLRGEGRLTGLRQEGTVGIARVRATTELPVERTLDLPEGRATLSGVEQNRSTIDYVVDDGTVHHARSVTVGTFELTVSPPSGQGTTPLRGELTIRVESTTERDAAAP